MYYYLATNVQDYSMHIANMNLRCDATMCDNGTV